MVNHFTQLDEIFTGIQRKLVKFSRIDPHITRSHRFKGKTLSPIAGRDGIPDFLMYGNPSLTVLRYLNFKILWERFRRRIVPWPQIAGIKIDGVKRIRSAKIHSDPFGVLATGLSLATTEPFVIVDQIPVYKIGRTPVKSGLVLKGA